MITDPLEHLQAGLRRLDLLIHRQILRLRAGYALSLDEFRGLYVSDEQVDALVDRVLGEQPEGADAAALAERAGAMRRDCDARAGEDLPWKRLAAAFGLSAFEQDVLLLALAPEIDLKYETLYAYLNNDVGRKWPTFDLALRLFDADRTTARRLLLPEGTLLGAGLLRPLPPAGQHPSWLATGFAAAPAVARFALGLDPWDPRLNAVARREATEAGWDDLPLPVGRVEALRRAAEGYRRRDPAPAALVFEGRRGAGRARTAGALCRSLGRGLLRVDGDALQASAEGGELARALALQQRLDPAGIYVEVTGASFDKEGRPLAEARRAVERLAGLPGPVVLGVAPGADWRSLLGRARGLAFSFEEPDAARRRGLWSRSLAAAGDGAVPEEVLDVLAERFVLNPGQIERAALTARDAGVFSEGALFEAARAESEQRLGRLAAKVRLMHGWDDLVLPPATMRRVREIAAAIRHRRLVYDGWGFERRIAAGRGLKVLFTGTPGTGKTMTAGVIARDLGLGLYKIDLSGVVSKYIGETEKNLDRIFRAAHASNAILFFDEADALFGKRSEVKDAHDRYANIETSYLLQKMEEHEGAVILATNLRKNIDEAFSRRMHYVVEFPVPDERQRERLWRGMFPDAAPLGDDVDFAFLARQFGFSGGDIQNVALDAAFLAAQDGRVVRMQQLVNAVARQLAKQGRLPSAAEFRQYHGLIREA